MTKKVLVVDDAKVVRISLGRIMTKLGFEVLEAANGQLAQEQMQLHDGISVVLLDWNMPVMNGYDFLVALRLEPKHITEPRVIMVTTETDMSSILKALAAGADEYIMKPFDKDMLMGKLDIVGVAYEND